MRVGPLCAVCTDHGLILAAPLPLSRQRQALRKPDIFYLPTPQPVVDAMLAIANVTGKDVIYDLGSGDGRIPITAARKYGARGVGIDIDPERIKEANENAKKEGVADKVTFLQRGHLRGGLQRCDRDYALSAPGPELRSCPEAQDAQAGHADRLARVRHGVPSGRPKRHRTVDGKTIYYWTIK